MMEVRRIGGLLVGLSGLIAGCNNSPSADQYRVVSQQDATQSQQSLEKTVAPDPMNDAESDSTAAKEPPLNDVPKTAAVEKAQPVDAAVPDVAAKTDSRADDQQPKDDAPKPAPKLLVTEKEFSTTAPDNSLRVSFDDIDLEKIFDIKEVSKDLPQHFPKWLKALDGQRVRMRGFMVPTFQADDLVAFTLARDTSACCFGPNPKVSYLIEVSMQKGKTSEYIDLKPFDVVGVLHVGDEVTPGRLYQIDNAIVIRK